MPAQEGVADIGAVSIEVLFRGELPELPPLADIERVKAAVHRVHGGSSPRNRRQLDRRRIPEQFGASRSPTDGKRRALLSSARRHVLACHGPDGFEQRQHLPDALPEAFGIGVA
jgi:hypothetical protein